MTGRNGHLADTCSPATSRPARLAPDRERPRSPTTPWPDQVGIVGGWLERPPIDAATGLQGRSGSLLEPGHPRHELVVVAGDPPLGVVELGEEARAPPVPVGERVVVAPGSQ